MLLRRITEHVKAQNWTAVALDFVIVVVGVFIGIQVANWNGVQQEIRQEKIIKKRLLADFEVIEQDIAEALSSHQRNRDGLQTVIETLDRGTLNPQDENSFREGLRYSYIHNNPAGRSGTFSELLSSGRVIILRDEELRRALIHYDNEVQEAEQIFSQIRVHQSAYTPRFTRHFDYAIAQREIQAGESYQPIGAFDLPSMLGDPEFKNAAHELREAQRYYFGWHLRNQISAANVLAILRADLSNGEG